MTRTNGISNKDSGESNPYLALREAKIARNQARLRELGLLSKKELPSSGRTTTPPTKTATTAVAKVETKPLVLRRSRRLSQLPENPDYTEPNVDLIRERKSKRSRITTTTRKTTRTTTTTTTKGGDKTPVSRPPPAANSVRAISINPENLVFGKDKVSGFLGVPMERTGKEFVIYESFERAALSEDRHRLEGSRLSFNKYSGVQEWKNSIFLWVNLGGKDGTVVNDFLEGGKQITWFGGSRMQDDTPVVQRLLRLGKAASPSSSSIILWCRRYEAEKKTYSPYVCLGRLGYQSHVPGSYPLSFVWMLLDYSALKDHRDKSVGKRFQQFITGNSG